jgi:hypothetical protein
MSKSVQIPSDIENTFACPGKDWTEEQRHRVADWVTEKEQLEHLYNSARAYFPREKPEAVWNEFFASEKLADEETQP